MYSAFQCGFERTNRYLNCTDRCSVARLAARKGQPPATRGIDLAGASATIPEGYFARWERLLRAFDDFPQPALTLTASVLGLSFCPMYAMRITGVLPQMSRVLVR